MARGRKKKAKSRPARGATSKAAARDSMFEGLEEAERRGDNRRALLLSRAALGDDEASVEAKEAALRAKKRLSYDPVALVFAGGGAALWLILLFLFVLGRS